MDRRKLLILAGAAGAAMSSPALADPEPPVSARAQALYRRALVLDANLSPPLGDGKLPLPASALEITRSSGVTVCKTTLGGFDEKFEDTVAEIAFCQQVIELYPDLFMQVRKADDFARAKREGKVGVIFSFEGAAMLEDKLDRFDLFRDLGVRVMQLSYNKTSPFGAGVLAPVEQSGLTDLGRQAVDRMNTLGIAIDLSHASRKMTGEVIALSKKPVVMTHGGCAAVYDHPRNKTDEQLKALADKGGTFGIYDLPYLAASPKQPDVDDYMAHMTHALKVCGEDHVGIGSDQGMEPFDNSPAAMAAFQKDTEARKAAGVAAPGEDRPPYVVGLNTPRRCEVICDALLKRGYPERVAEKVLGLNFARAFSDIW
ncbi:MAG TPA: membrane dipeptidase [Caulobacteraceae bacterium]|jgi:membrane dipeptidase|nr:membrane dipeptidase [Caulobacteraceae bacterium]